MLLAEFLPRHPAFLELLQKLLAAAGETLTDQPLDVLVHILRLDRGAHAVEFADNELAVDQVTQAFSQRLLLAVFPRHRITHSLLNHHQLVLGRHLDLIASDDLAVDNGGHTVLAGYLRGSQLLGEGGDGHRARHGGGEQKSE